jgi:hypothetical protein
VNKEEKTMKKLNNKTIVIALALFALTNLAGCHKIFFHNGADSTTFTQNEDYHHEVAIELVELSEPVDLNKMCQGQPWRTVKTERTFVNALIGIITQPIYGQWTVSQACGT